MDSKRRAGWGEVSGQVILGSIEKPRGRAHWKETDTLEGGISSPDRKRSILGSRGGIFFKSVEGD